MKPSARTYIRLVGASVGVAVILAALGYVPTRRIAGGDSTPAMFAGIAISLLASCLGSIPIALAGEQDPRKMPQAILLATALRFGIALLLAAPAALSGWFDQATLVLWVGMTYLLLLVPDTVLAARVAAKRRGNQA